MHYSNVHSYIIFSLFFKIVQNHVLFKTLNFVWQKMNTDQDKNNPGVNEHILSINCEMPKTE